MGDVINLNKARKTKVRSMVKAQAAENRVKFGRAKADKTRAEAAKALASKSLDGHKFDD